MGKLTGHCHQRQSQQSWDLGAGLTLASLFQGPLCTRCSFNVSRQRQEWKKGSESLRDLPVASNRTQGRRLHTLSKSYSHSSSAQRPDLREVQQPSMERPGALRERRLSLRNRSDSLGNWCPPSVTTPATQGMARHLPSHPSPATEAIARV